MALAAFQTMLDELQASHAEEEPGSFEPSSDGELLESEILEEDVSIDEGEPKGSDDHIAPAQDPQDTAKPSETFLEDAGAEIAGTETAGTGVVGTGDVGAEVAGREVGGTKGQGKRSMRRLLQVEQENTQGLKLIETRLAGMNIGGRPSSEDP